MDHFKTLLEGELALVEKELRDLGVEDREAPGVWEPKVGEFDESATEPDEVADRLEEYEEHEEELPVVEKHRRNIERALARIEEGSYGICEVGGEDIEEDRLEVNPSARTCKAHMEQEGELPE